MKKYIVMIFSVLIFVAFLTLALNFSFKPVDSLIRPPKIEGENSQIQAAFEASIDGTYILKAPLTGEYRSSFILVDLDSNGEDEVIVFYCSSSAVDVVRMNILDKINEDWQSIADLESSNNDIQQVSFADIDSDGSKEIIVGWRIFETQLSNTLDVYKIVDRAGAECITKLFSASYNDLLISDIDNDGKTDILVFEKTTGNNISRIKGEFITFEEGKASSKGEFTVDPAISSISSVCYERDDEQRINIFIDGYLVDSGMTTDMITWSNSDGNFSRPDYVSGISLSAFASRNTNINCSDINSDEKIEIPVERYIPESRLTSLNGSELKNQSAIVWNVYDSLEFKPVKYEIINSHYDYSIKINADWFERITVDNNLENGQMTFYSLEAEGEKNKKPKKKDKDNNEFEPGQPQPVYNVGEKLFTVFVSAEQDYNLYEFSGYRLLVNKNGYNYYFQIYDYGKKLGITRENIKRIFIA